MVKLCRLYIRARLPSPHELGSLISPRAYVFSSFFFSPRTLFPDVRNIIRIPNNTSCGIHTTTFHRIGAAGKY